MVLLKTAWRRKQLVILGDVKTAAADPSRSELKADGK